MVVAPRAFGSSDQHRIHPPAARNAGCSLTSMGVRANLSKRLPPAVYAALEPALYFLVLFLGYFLPLALLVGLAGMMSNYEPLGCWVYGSGILLGGTSMLLFLLGLGMWRARQWAVSGSVAAALALSALLPLVAQLFIVLQLPSCAVECEDSKGGRCTLTEFPYTAVTAISMALNSIPVIAIVFLQLGACPLARAVCPLPPNGARALGAYRHTDACTAWRQAMGRASRCSNTCQTSPTRSLWSWDIAALAEKWRNSSLSMASRS